MKLDLEYYTYEWRKPTGVKECIQDLIDGHPTASAYLFSDLQLKRYIERNAYLLEWPLVRFKYAALLLSGCLMRLPNRTEELVECEDKERGMAMMLSLAEAGLATAQFEVGWALRPAPFSKSHKEYEPMVQWVIKASRQDYWLAQSCLEWVYDKIDYLEFSDSTLWNFLVELARFSKRYHGSLAKGYLNKFDWNIENFDRDRWYEDLNPPSYLLIPGVNTPPMPDPPFPVDNAIYFSPEAELEKRQMHSTKK